MTDHLLSLVSAAPPWLLRTAMHLSTLEGEIAKLKVDSGFETCWLDGGKMNTLDGVFDEFANGLKFPDYFGFNSAAFDECLNDLSWLNVDGICIVILATGQLLVDERDEIAWLLQLLEDTCKEWSVAAQDGEAWDRQPIPFHVLFHAVSRSATRLPTQIANLPTLE